MNTQATHWCVASVASIGIGASTGWYLSTGPSDEVNADRGVVTSSGPSAGTQPSQENATPEEAHGEALSPPRITESRQNPAAPASRGDEPVAVSAERSDQLTSETDFATEATRAKKGEQYRGLAQALLQFVDDDRQRLAAANRAVDNTMDWWKKTKVDLKFTARDPDFSRFLDDTGREISRLYFSTTQLSEGRKAMLDKMERAAASVIRDPSTMNAESMGQMVNEYRLLMQQHSQAGQEFGDYIERVLKTLEQHVNQ